MNIKKLFSVLALVQMVGLCAVIASAFAGSTDPFRDAYVWAGINGVIAVGAMGMRKRVEVEAPNITKVLWACAAAGVWVAVANYLYGG